MKKKANSPVKKQEVDPCLQRRSDDVFKPPVPIPVQECEIRSMDDERE